MNSLLGRMAVFFQSQLQETAVGDRVPAFVKEKGRWKCQRCGNQDPTRMAIGACQNCNGECLYCLACLPLGKVKQCASLVCCQEKNPAFETCEVSVFYKGQLSPQQSHIGMELVNLVNKGCKEHLVWAVTGAGKTEMVFETIRSVLVKGGRVGIAAPRIDVCQELALRLEEAFPTVRQIVLHGLAHVPYERVPLTIATTHQMLRFYRAFDVLIVDEVDAFPYKDSEILHVAVEHAVKYTGTRIYLTATPSQKELTKIRRGELSYSLLPARYHRHPLIVPEFIWVGNWSRALQQKRLSKIVKQWIQQHLEAQIPFLLFVPSIAQISLLEEVIKKEFPSANFSSISSKEEARAERVTQMRNGALQFLVTTTILERGVTFKGIDVAVLEANHAIYTREVLVQIAGRVGRYKEAAGGQVTFFHDGLTIAMKEARKEIRHLNSIAIKEGLLEGVE